MIEHHVEIADNVRIHTQAFIPEFSVLEEGCWIGPNVVLTNAKYPLSPGVKDQLAGPVIRQRRQDRRQRRRSFPAWWSARTRWSAPAPSSCATSRLAPSSSAIPLGSFGQIAELPYARNSDVGSQSFSHILRRVRPRKARNAKDSRCSARTTMNIPFVDLKAQYESIKPEIDAAIAAVIAQTAFIGGPLRQGVRGGVRALLWRRALRRRGERNRRACSSR